MINRVKQLYNSLPWCRWLDHKWEKGETKRSAIIPGIKNIRRITFPIRTCKRCGKLEATVAPVTDNMTYNWVSYEHSRKALKVDKRWLL